MAAAAAHRLTGAKMDKSLFAFIWRYSKRDQLILLLLTVMSFPLLYASLELPKRIINDAIGSVTSYVLVSGVAVTQVQYLVCLLYTSPSPRDS